MLYPWEAQYVKESLDCEPDEGSNFYLLFFVVSITLKVKSVT